MRYYQIIQDNYIIAFGIGPGGESISEERYNILQTLLTKKPPRNNMIDYRLRKDLTWESYEIEPIPELQG